MFRRVRHSASALLGVAVRRLRRLASAPFGVCAVWRLRRLAPAPSGACAVWRLRRLAFCAVWRLLWHLRPSAFHAVQRLPSGRSSPTRSRPPAQSYFRMPMSCGLLSGLGQYVHRCATRSETGCAIVSVARGSRTTCTE